MKQPVSKVIFIAGVARSGTSWIGQVFNSCPSVTFRFQPLFAYEFKNKVNEDSPAQELKSLFDEMSKVQTPFLTQQDKVQSGEYPYFEKQEDGRVLVFKENRYQSMLGPMIRRVPYLQGLGVVRHPCAVLNSWRKNSKEFPSGSELSREWRFANCKNLGNEDYFGYYKWKEVAHIYLDLQEQHPERFTVLRYEDAVAQPSEVFTYLFSFFGLSFTEQTAVFLSQSAIQHSESYYGVYKHPSVVDQWQNELDPEIVKEIYEDLRGTRLEQFLVHAHE